MERASSRTLRTNCRRATIGDDCDDVDMIDIDGDFDLDVLFNMHAGDNNLWENDGNGNFTDVSDQFPGQPNQFHYNPGVCDVDNDGDLDVWVDNMGPSYSEQLLINDGSGKLHRRDRRARQRQRQQRRRQRRGLRGLRPRRRLRRGGVGH